MRKVELKIKLPADLVGAIEDLAELEVRSPNKQIEFLLKLAMDLIISQSQGGPEEEMEQTPLIGFRMPEPEECEEEDDLEEEEEEDSFLCKKCKKNTKKKTRKK